MLTGALISTIRYLFFDSQQQSRDLSVIANSQPSLHIAAASGTASNGSGSPSAKAPNTTGSAQSLPAEPTGASTSMGSTSAALTWTDNSNNEAGFVTQYRPAGGSAWIAGPSVGANVTSATVTGLNSSTSYTFQVGARNSAGTHWSAYFYGTTAAQPSSPPPPPPTSPAPYHAGRQVAVASQATGGDSGHTGPSNSYAAGPTHPANSPLWIVCHVNGQAITGPYDTTTMWDLATDGYYYTDAWLYTGTNGPAVPPC